MKKHNDKRVYVIQENTLSVQVCWEVALCRYVRSTRHLDTVHFFDLHIKQHPLDVNGNYTTG